MDERIVKVSLQKAKEWYNSNNEGLKEIALQAFSKKELTHKSFYNIKTVEDAIQYLRDNNICKDLIDEYQDTNPDSYSEKICEYRIIVAALTNNEKRKLEIDNCWFPVVQFCKIGTEKICQGNKKVGTIEYDRKKYAVIGGYAYYDGLGNFDSSHGMSYSVPNIVFQSVSSKEIAQYISEQFGRLLFEIQYGGVNCYWKWID